VTPAEFQARILAPSAARFPFRDSPEARALLLAIAGQESGWSERVQDGGPARGFWQFEKNGGVLGVLTHALTGDMLKAHCAALAISPGLDTIYEAIAWCDPLAYALARLLVWTDPAPLPTVGDAAGGWSYYERLWRPGKPDAARWTDRYAEALLTGEIEPISA
jgi:hypothetical protein